MVSAVWLPGVLGVCSRIAYFNSSNLNFLDFYFPNFVFMLDCCLYVCPILSVCLSVYLIICFVYLFVCLCLFPACPTVCL